MENTLPTTQDILEAINAFSDRVDQRFEGIDQRLAGMVTKAEFGSAMETMVTKAEFSSAMETITMVIDHNDRKTNILIQELVQAESLSSVAAIRVLHI